jgi:hypothetical protein
MHSRSLSLVTAFVFAAFASLSSASAITPKPGHYTSWGSGNEHVTFTLSSSGTISNLHIDGHQVMGVIHSDASNRNHFSFYKRTTRGGGRRYSGHGIWFENDRCHGDIRHYFGIGENNSYHVWQAHFAHGLSPE